MEMCLFFFRFTPIVYSECVSVALFIQHAKRLVVLLSVVRLAPQNFPTLSHKQHDFRKKSLLNTKGMF